jgi:hypothetical protein
MHIKGENPSPELGSKQSTTLSTTFWKEPAPKALGIDSLLDFFLTPEIWQRKAFIYDNNGDYRKAIECFDKQSP